MKSQINFVNTGFCGCGQGRPPFPYDPILAPYSEQENTNSSWSSNVHYGNSENEERECY